MDDEKELHGQRPKWRGMPDAPAPILRHGTQRPIRPGSAEKFIVILALAGGWLSIRWVGGSDTSQTLRRWRLAVAEPFLVLAAFPLSREGRPSFEASTQLTALPARVRVEDHQWWLERAPLDSRWRHATDLQVAYVTRLDPLWPLRILGGLRGNDADDFIPDDGDLIVEGVNGVSR